MVDDDASPTRSVFPDRFSPNCEGYSIQYILQMCRCREVAGDLTPSLDDTVFNVVELVCSTVRVSAPLPPRNSAKHSNNGNDVSLMLLPPVM
uniref:Uncharacterized protein n=1 Tax=Echinococcus granulosus TaxID=6210 RepID=A0A068WZ57_ECHGR|nr:hypothetical protein EgrG_002064900 [Echinococcus granulosus]